MNWAKWEVQANRSIIRNMLEIWFVMRNNSRSEAMLSFKEVELPLEVSEGDYHTRSAFIDKNINPISIPWDIGQMLIDELWRVGLRPSEGTGSAGSLKATEDHLQSMRGFSQRLLTLIEKKWEVLE